jgi:outer membrane protein assembly factor BamB
MNRILLLSCFLPLVLPAEDWTRFRGPNGSGVSSDAGYPSEFGKEKNLVWRTPVRAGKSSPVLTRRHVFLTSSEDDKLYTQCFDRETGKPLWERAESRISHDVANVLNHPAAITPVSDGENVYAFFKDFGLVSYDPAGKLRWKAQLAPFTNTMGLGASPIVAGNSVVVLADQVDGLSYIAAFDLRNGEMRWKKSREEGEGWGTPLLYSGTGKDSFIVTTSRGRFGAYRVANGQRTLNTDGGLATTIVASPIIDGNTVFVLGYGSETPAPFDDRLSRLDKNKDGQLTPDEYGTDAFIHGIGQYVGNRDLIVTRDEWDAKQREVIGPNRLMAARLEPHEGSVALKQLWTYDRSFTGVIPSPLLYNGVLYVVRNGGILTTFDPETGAVLKTGRLNGAIAGYSSSPVAADGLVYLANEDGKVAVVRAGAEWDVQTVNDLGESCHATPALSGGSIYLRTGEALYRFGVAPPQKTARLRSSPR